MRTGSGLVSSAADERRARLRLAPTCRRLAGFARAALRLGAVTFLDGFFSGADFFTLLFVAFFGRDGFFLAMAKVYHPRTTCTT